MKVVVLERDCIGTDVSMDRFGEYGELVCYPNTSITEVAERVKDADVIGVNKIPMNETTLKDAKNVKLICEFATGYNNIDLDYCKRRGIAVTNVKGYSTPTVAQHTFALALYLIEHMKHYDEYVKDGSYAAQDLFCNFSIPFTELCGKVWGIIGMGNIGKEVAKIAKAFGCTVKFHSVTGKSTCTDYEQVSFDTLLAESDILSLHCPLSDLTQDLINREALSKMKKTAVLINVARGPVVNSKDLYDALHEGVIAAAGLDVLEKEPMDSENPLGQMKDSNKLIITPHLAWASIEARTRLIDEVYQNMDAYFKGQNRNRIV